MSPSSSSFFYLLRAWPTVVMITALGFVLAIVVSLIQPLLYRSTTKILVTPEITGVDPYTASRSAESAADQLATMLGTSSIYTSVLATGRGIDRAYFPTDVLAFQEAWQDSVEATVTRGSGIMTISAYHPNPQKAEALAAAVAQVYVTEGSRYANGNISVQVIDDPVNSRYPVRPNVLVNACSGFFLGLLGGLGYVVLQHDRKKYRHRITHFDT